MAARHEKPEKKLQREVAKKTDDALGKLAIGALVACALINALYPNSVKDFIFYGLLAAISKDVVRYLLRIK